MLKKRTSVQHEANQEAVSSDGGTSGGGNVSSAGADDSSITNLGSATKAKIQVNVDQHGMFSSLSTPSLSLKEQQQAKEQEAANAAGSGGGNGEHIHDASASSSKTNPHRVTREEVMSLNSLVIGSGKQGGNNKATRVSSAGAVSQHQQPNTQEAINKSIKAGRLERVQAGVPLRTQSGHVPPKVTPEKDSQQTTLAIPAFSRSQSSLGRDGVSPRGPRGSPMQAHQDVQRAAALQRVNSRMVSVMPADRNHAVLTSPEKEKEKKQRNAEDLTLPPQLSSIGKIMAHKSPLVGSSAEAGASALPVQPAGGAGPGAGPNGGSPAVNMNIASAAAAGGTAGAGAGAGAGAAGKRPSPHLSKVKREKLKERNSFSETFPRARNAENSVSDSGALSSREKYPDAATRARDAAGLAGAETSSPSSSVAAPHIDPLMSTTGGSHLRRSGADRYNTLTTIDTENGVVLVDLGEGRSSSPKVFVPPISIEAIADKSYAHSYAAPTSGRHDIGRGSGGVGSAGGVNHDGMNTFPAPGSSSASNGFNTIVKDEEKARENDRVITERLLEAKALDRNKRTAPGATMHKFSLWGNAAAAKPTGTSTATLDAIGSASGGGSGGEGGVLPANLNPFGSSNSNSSAVPASSTTALFPTTTAGVRHEQGQGDGSMHARRAAREARSDGAGAGAGAGAAGGGGGRCGGGGEGGVDSTPPRSSVPAAPNMDLDKTPQMQHGRKEMKILPASTSSALASHVTHPPAPLSRKLFEDESSEAHGTGSGTGTGTGTGTGAGKQMLDLDKKSQGQGQRMVDVHSPIVTHTQIDTNINATATTTTTSTERSESGLVGSPSQATVAAGKGRVASALRNKVGNAKSQQLQHSPQKAPRPSASSEEEKEKSGRGNSALVTRMTQTQGQGQGQGMVSSPITEESNILTATSTESDAGALGEVLEVSDPDQLHTARSDKTGGTEGSVEEDLEPAEAGGAGGNLYHASSAAPDAVAAQPETASPQQMQIDSAASTFNTAQFGSGSKSGEESGFSRFAPIQVDKIHAVPTNLAAEDPDALLPLTERSGYSGHSSENKDGSGHPAGGGSHSHSGSSARDAALSPTLSELSHGSDDENNEGDGTGARRRAVSNSHGGHPGPAQEKIVFHDAPTTPLKPVAQKAGSLNITQETPQAGMVAAVDAGGTTYSPLRWKRGALIGEGTFGKVYKGMNERTGELLAVKQLSLLDGSSEDVEGLQKEISVMWHLDHANIVRYLGTARSDRYLFIVIEYVSGGSISNMLQQFGPFVEKLIRRFTLHILSGVKYLHDIGIIHRDIKGGNVLVTNAGVAKLADFGCSKQLAGMCTASMEESMRAIRGSVPWMAPEVIKQSGHGRSSDIWSVGATVIEMGTGKPPWPEFTNNLAALFHVATSKVPPPAPTHLSRNCASFLGRCMAIEPGERATAAHLLATDPFILSNSPHAQSLDSGGFNSPVDAVGVTRGAVTTSDEKCLATPRTDMLEKVKAAYENSIAVSQLLFPDDDIDEQLSVASSIAIDTPGKEDGGAMGQHGTRQAARK